MRKIIALLACLWALCAGATNITNYPVRTTFNAAYWFLLSDVTAQTNWNLPGNYVASTTDLNTSSNILWGFTTNVNFTNIYVTNLVVLSNAYFFSTNQFNTAYITNLYASNAWIISLTVTNPITNISLTANTIVKSDANKALASVANGTGALTNNNAGLFGWHTYASLNDITNVVTNLLSGFQTPWLTNINGNGFALYNATNVSVIDTVLAGMLRATNGGTNWLGGITTIDGNNIFSTNTFTMAADLSKAYGRITTNADFAFLSPLNVDKNKDQTTVMTVINTKGSPIQATEPVNVHVVPGSVMWVTNVTKFTWNQDGVETNLYAVPTW